MKINLETLFFRRQKSDGGENMFLPSFMRKQSRVSCFNEFYYREHNILCNINYSCFGAL